VTALGKLFRTTAFKISLAYLVISAIGSGLVLVSVGGNIKDVIDQQISQTIDADLVGLSEQYSQGGITTLVDIVERRTRVPGAGLYLVTTHAGEPIAGNVLALPAGVLDHPGVVETSYRVKGDTTTTRRALARIFALSGGFRLLVGHDLAEGESLRPILAHALLNSLISFTIVGTLGGLFLARRVLRRVDSINANARTIVAGDLTGRLPLAGTGDELDRLVENINAMLDRIAELMAGLKEVSDNVAHDLKTPLTRLRSRAEQALRLGQSPEVYREALEKVIEESDGLIRIFDALLMIARAEAGSGREGMIEFDAGLVASDVGELYEPVAEADGVHFEGDIESGLIVLGSRELVGQAIANLVDNALKYGVAPGWRDETESAITLTARRRGGFVEIAVSDRGPGIAPDDRSRITERFVRLENSRSRPGSGLGLSLVAAVARLHNGTLRIEDNDPGLRIVIVLPAAKGGPPLLPAPAPQVAEPSPA
jgi:signal transduction histidine kinase